MSMVLVPAPARITSASLSAASNTARSTLVLRTTSASTPAIRPGSSAVVSAGLHRTAMSPRGEFGDGLVGDRVGEQQVHGGDLYDVVMRQEELKAASSTMMELVFR